MLKHLYIKNFALIDKLDIDFHSGFSVISGETGAGKSIILGAIGLLLGNRADSKQIKQGEKKCIIEALFDIEKYDFEIFFNENNIDFEPKETLLRRELTDKGKSRAFINDTPVSLSQMKILGEQLVDIHSQHQNLLLQKQDFQLNVIDTMAQNTAKLKEYQVMYSTYISSEKKLEQLKNDIRERKENEDFIRFQFDELDNANLQEGEQESLEIESRALSHAEEIKSALYEADNALNNEDTGVIDMLKKASEAMQNIISVFPKNKDLAERLESAYIELQDIGSEIGTNKEDIDFNPMELDRINQRLDNIYHLEQKFHVETLKELIDTKNDLKIQLNSIDNSSEDIRELEMEVEQKRNDCRKQAKLLTATRQKAAKLIEEELKKKLIPMGIPNIRFCIDIHEKPMSDNGTDAIEFLFSANKNSPLQPVAHVASGGEIARVMLSMKAMITGALQLPTIIFDEIDTGVSGKIAQQMALTMQEMGKHDRQVISITHLPQIAAMGTSHYKVEKKDTEMGTTSHLRELTQEERITEIAQMLSGSDISEAALRNAKELLEYSIREKIN
ncbi:DNA repair protein RecN [Prevotella brunnea]|uniref:DNA repair protein RecN n=1 Tax=Prevotella brunnea TaxID=2508867 RepID=A0A5C8GQ35_9BACT|nr:DNA repair protein RecN [Prevotella brunnea]TXJ63393.1 DNA repair protein RecN [Prevotella brunnea]